jgi:putative Holliday junction resolvase
VLPAPILPLIEAVTHWPERGALVGLDLGTKTIGVAVSDPDRRLATGVETIQRKAFKADAARLLSISGERNAVGFVLGLSTAAVERELIGMDVSRARRAEVIDEHAAIFILQGALDRLTKLRGDT